MDSKALTSILSKIPFNILLVAFLANTAWDYYGFKSNEDSPLQLKKNEIVAAQQEVKKLEAKVQEAKNFLAGLDGKKAELRRLAVELETTKATISEDMDVPSLMKALLTEAKRVGITVVSLKPGPVNNAEFYTEQTFDLSFRGVYFQLVGFLDRVSNLQKIVRIENLDVARVSTSVSRYVEIQGTIQMKAYKYNRSKADEVLKQQQIATASGATMADGVKQISSPATPGAADSAGGAQPPVAPIVPPSGQGLPSNPAPNTASAGPKGVGT